jgi:hypothetical protein
MGLGGMKLAASKPWRSRSASHSLSRTSVLRPGTALMCCGLTSRIVRPSSNTLEIGYQYTPVDSIARCSTADSDSHASKRNKSAVIVEKVRVCLLTAPFEAVSSTVTTTVFLWTSSPAQRANTTCRCTLLLPVHCICNASSTAPEWAWGAPQHLTRFLGVLRAEGPGDREILEGARSQLFQQARGTKPLPTAAPGPPVPVYARIPTGSTRTRPCAARRRAAKAQTGARRIFIR